MPDMENVINGLNDIGGFIAGRIGFEQARNFLRTIDETVVLLKEQEDLGTELTNAVELIHKKNERIEKLLKEQEAVKPVLDEQTGRIWLCGKCGTYVGFEDNDPHDPNEFDKYCRECGRPVLWEGR